MQGALAMTPEQEMIEGLKLAATAAVFIALATTALLVGAHFGG